MSESADGDLGVRVVALSWVDNAGISRVKAIPARRLEHANRWGVGMAPVFDTFLVDDSRAGGVGFDGPVGDLRLRPDLTRLTPLAAQHGWAWAPADRYSQDGTPYAGCQRSFAIRMTREAQARGIELRMGFETEWTVEEDPDAAATLSGRSGPGPAYGLARLTGSGPYLLDIADVLADQRIDLLQIHPEYETGQYEVSTAPESPVDAADTAVLVRHSVRALSARHGLLPSFAPLTTPSGAGNGGHLHLSPWRAGANLLHGGSGPYGMTPDGEAFLAGILENLPALTAIGCPSPASYLRLIPSQWAGAYQCWGRENREAALRLVTGQHGAADTANVEVKCFDQAANPYLLVGTVIAAGLAGIDEGLRLPPEYRGDPASAPPITLDRLGIRRLPDTLTASIGQLEESAMLRRAMGDRLVDAVLAVRRGEEKLFASRTPAEIVEATRWRF
ncbi:glutamine synthetase family protein [Streptomyces sp. NPDC001893]|uniref:glutamine synthetase family protein n=1 Tax=Streptomyces sp. NPDC001893 TaxID=3154530 RepID=UPI0033168A12